MDKKTMIKNFEIVSYAIGGIFFLLIGIRGFVQIAGINGTPQIGLFIFTVLTTAFGIWSVRSFLRNCKNFC